MGYIIKNAYHQSKLLKSREPIEILLNDPDLDSKTKEQLKLVQSAKEFAKTNLLLNTENIYNTYVKLDDQYVSYVVNASEKHQLEPYLWNFPFIGSLPYKGYFTKKEALFLKEKLEKKGLDTYLRGVSAYSTLGWFDDPVLSSMLRYENHELINTVIHESVHSTIFLKNQADFNEQLATFIGDKGTLLYFQNSQYLDKDNILKKINAQEEDKKLFYTFILDEIKQLKKWYQSISQKEALENRDKQFEKIKIQFSVHILPKLKTNSFTHFQNKEINNAYLLLFKTYNNNHQIFKKYLESLDNDLKLFVQNLKKIKFDSDPYQQIRALTHRNEH